MAVILQEKDPIATSLDELWTKYEPSEEEKEKETFEEIKKRILSLLQESVEKILNPIQDVNIYEEGETKENKEKRIKEAIDSFWNTINKEKTLTIENFIEISKIQEEFLLKTILEWKDKAHMDWLTKLPNLAAFKEEIFPEIFRIIKRESFEKKEERIKYKEFCVAMIDLDNFKKINDTCGHEETNELIKQIANLFRITFRPDDEIARFGGDEFSIIFSSAATNEKGNEISPKERQIIPFKRLQTIFKIIKENSLEGLAEMPIFKDKVIDLKIFKEILKKVDSITFSGGIFQISEKEIKEILKKGSLTEKDITIWLKKADEALYDAKGAGKNQIKLYEE